MSGPVPPEWYLELQIALLRQMPRPNEINQVVAENWINNQGSLKKHLARVLLPTPAFAPVDVAKSELFLEPARKVLVRGTTSKFISKKMFVRETRFKSKLKLGIMSNSFEEWFLADGGKVEEPTGVTTLRYHTLRRNASDAQIIDELGGIPKVEATLTEIYHLLINQPGTKKGALEIGGQENVFYVRDRFGRLRSVSVYSFGRGWGIAARSTRVQIGWREGVRVFSRDTAL